MRIRAGLIFSPSETLAPETRCALQRYGRLYEHMILRYAHFRMRTLLKKKRLTRKFVLLAILFKLGIR